MEKSELLGIIGAKRGTGSQKVSTIVLPAFSIPGFSRKSVSRFSILRCHSILADVDIIIKIITTQEKFCIINYTGNTRNVT